MDIVRYNIQKDGGDFYKCALALGKQYGHQGISVIHILKGSSLVFLNCPFHCSLVFDSHNFKQRFSVYSIYMI